MLNKLTNFEEKNNEQIKLAINRCQKELKKNIDLNARQKSLITVKCMYKKRKQVNFNVHRVNLYKFDR